MTIHSDHFPKPSFSHPAFEVFKIHEYGFVRLVDMMPSPMVEGGVTADQSLAQAARVSYGSGTKTVSEDEGLIDYLIRHRHTSPIEMVEMKFHARMPIFVARQWIRHRMVSVNEYSARYSVVKDFYYVPSEEDCKGQSKLNKQGSEQQILDPNKARDLIMNLSEDAYKKYCELLSEKDYLATDQSFGDELEHLGLSRELARIVLPVNYYTEWYWKIDLHNLFHFLSLRADPHAQSEIRIYAEAILKICELVAPVATNSFKNHRMNAVSFSGDEKNLLKILNLYGFDSLFITNFNLLSKGRQREFKAKLEDIGILSQYPEIKEL
jgi:thymidylate synthase (FAD)